ncbi:PEP-CTERM sorting domain-containing protein [Pontiellaceae bacterium B12219]|nr:PEP-CTERM sorting domain-containing protein [Pontiellaceae bacterium B12219]
MTGLANAAIVSTYEFSATESFTTLPEVSTSDLAASLTDERDPAWGTAGNFLAGRATDGAYGTGFGNNTGNSTDEANMIVRYKIDLGSAQEIGAVNSYAYGDLGKRSQQYFSLYGSVADTASWDETDATTWTLIGSVDTREAAGPDKYGATSIYDDGGAALGTYRELMWVTSYANVAANGQYESTIYKEFDVIAIPEPATIGLIAAFGGGLLFVRRYMMI